MHLAPDRSSVFARIVYIHLDALLRSNPELEPNVEIEAKLTSVNGHAGYLYRNATRGYHAWTYKSPSGEQLMVVMGDRNQVRYDEHLRAQPTERCETRSIPLNEPTVAAKMLVRYLSLGRIF